MEFLKQELINAASTYKADVPHPNKALLLAIPLNILAGHFQYNQTHPSTAQNIKSYLKAEVAIKTHRFQKAKSHMTNIVPPPCWKPARWLHEDRSSAKG